MNSRKLLFLLFKITVSSVLLYILISRIDSRNLLNIVRNVNPQILFLCSGIYILATYVSSIRWKILAFSRLSVSRLFSLYMIGSFFNTVLPGIIGGDAVKAYYLYRETGEAGISMASVFMDRYTGFVSIMMIALLALPFGLTYIKGTELQYLLPVIFLGLLLGSILFFRMRLGSGIKILRDFYGFFDAYRNLKEASPVILKGLLLSAIIQLMNMFAIYLITLELGASISFVLILIFVPIIVTVATIPVSISGLGVREAAFVILFAKAGLPSEMAVSISLLWFISVVIGSLPGLLFYALNKSRARGEDKGKI